MISVIIVQYNNAELTLQAIESFQKYIQCGYEIILIDNASTESKATELLDGLSGVFCIRNQHNDGFGKANNLGAANAHGDILLFLNSDTITVDDFVSPLVEVFDQNPTLGIVGPRLLNRDRTFQLSAGKLPSFWQELKDKFLYRLVDKKNKSVQRIAEKKFSARWNVGWVTGAAMFIRKSVFEACGGFDENIFMYFEDKDLCGRVRKLGYQILYLPESTLIHLRGASSSTESRMKIDTLYRESQRYYYAKHRSVLEQSLLHFYLKLTGKKSGK